MYKSKTNQPQYQPAANNNVKKKHVSFRNQQSKNR